MRRLEQYSMAPAKLCVQRITSGRIDVIMLWTGRSGGEYIMRMPRCLATRGWRSGQGLRIAKPPELEGDAHAGFTADSFRYKKGDREDPGVFGIFSVALKRKGTLGMSPFLPSSRKNDSL